MRTPRAFLFAIFSAWALTACPTSGIVCQKGTTRCGEGCVDIKSDIQNCGGCGVVCGSAEECREGVCTCQPATTSCFGQCVVTQYDARHCGECGNACQANQVCDKGDCKEACTEGTDTRCGASCVNTATDPNHCGACDKTCTQGQSCRAGSCQYDAVAACYWTGQIVGFSPETGSRGPLASVGTNPFTLAAYQEKIFVADGQDNRMYQAVLAESGVFAQAAVAQATGSIPNQIVVSPPWVYVVNAGSATLQIMKESTDLSGSISLESGVAGGVALQTVAEVPFGMNTFPQGVAKVGNVLWVPLYGGIGAEAGAAGQAVALVDISDPLAPTEIERIDLKGIDLKPFGSATPMPRPWALIASSGKIYVALNNLTADPTSPVPGGPGMIARIDAVSKQLAAIDLGADRCLNPQWISSMGNLLIVSCGGRVHYNSDFSVSSIEAAGLVVLNSDEQFVGEWSSVCPTGGSFSDGGVCTPLFPGRFAVSGNRVLLADQNAGRVVTLDVTSSGITEVRGLGNPIHMCPDTVSGFSNVSDVLSLSSF